MIRALWRLIQNLWRKIIPTIEIRPQQHQEDDSIRARAYRNSIPFECIIPLNALIKFVRNVPSLQWFRSDLTQENIDLLRLERPDIEFLD
jgi:hypothetical protein